MTNRVYDIKSDSETFTIGASGDKHTLLHSLKILLPAGTSTDEGFLMVKTRVPNLTTASEIHFPAGLSMVAETFDPDIDGTPGRPVHMWVTGCSGGKLQAEFDQPSASSAV